MPYTYKNLHFFLETARFVTYFTRQRVVAFGFRFSVEVHKSQSLFVCLSEPRKCVQEVFCLLYRISNTFDRTMLNWPDGLACVRR